MKYNCEMIRDLMPLCADGVASESSQQAVQTHLRTCVECAKEWEAVKGDLQIPLQEVQALPAEERYRQTAKRYRKKRVLRIIYGFIGIVMMLLVLACSPLAYGHLTARGALRSAIRHSTLSKYSDFEIVCEKKWKASERTLNDSNEDAMYWLMDKEDPTCIRFYQFARGEWNLYDERASGVLPYDASAPLMLMDVVTCPAYGNVILLPVYVNDASVKTVEITIDGETQSGTPNEKGVCLLQFRFNAMIYQLMEKGEWQGKAMDADGNVCCVLEYDKTKYAAYKPYGWVRQS